MLRWLLFTIIYILVTLYGFQAIRTVTKNIWIHYVFIAIAVIIAGNLIIQFGFGSGGRVLSPPKSYAFGFILAFTLFNAVLIVFLSGEDIIRFFSGLYSKYFTTNETFHMPSRRKFVSGIAIGVAAIPFVSLLYGKVGS